MTARLGIEVRDWDDKEILAPAGTVFEWDDSSTHQRVCGYLLFIEKHEVEFL